LSRAGVNPFRQGAFAGEFIADPFLFLKAPKALKALRPPSDAEVAAYNVQLGSRSTDALADAAAGDAAARQQVDQEYEELFGPGEDPMDIIGGRPGPQSPPGAPRAPEDGPDFGVAGTNQFDVNTDSIELNVEDFAGEPFNISQPEAGGAQLGNFGMFETPFMARNYTDVSPSQPIPLDPNVQRVVDDPYQVYEFGEDLTDPVDGTVIPAGTAILWPERARDQLSDFFPELRIDMDLEPQIVSDTPQQGFTGAAAEDAAAREVVLGVDVTGVRAARADRLRGTSAESVANDFEDNLNSRLGTDTEPDIDSIMQSIMESPDASAARVVADELGISPEDVSADALFLIRGRNMGTISRAPAATEPTPAPDQDEIPPTDDDAPQIVSDTPQQGFTGTVDLPPADPDTGSQLMSTTALNQPFPVLADRVSIRGDLAQIPAAAINRQGDVAAYSPLRQLIAALPEDRALSKDEILRTLDPNTGTEEFRNSVQRDIQGSQFDEWVKTHVSDDGITREELLSKYDQYAPQIRAINVLESDLGGGSNLFPGSIDLPNSGAQESIDDDFIAPANNGDSMRGHIYLTNPTSATIKYRKPDGEVDEWALEASDAEDVNDHGMTVEGRDSTNPLGKQGALGYFGHIRYVVIEDAAGRRMMLVQEIQSNHTVTQARGDDVVFLTPKEQENVQYLVDNPDILKDFEFIDDIDAKTQTFDLETLGSPVTIEQVEAKYGGMGKLVAEQMLDNTSDSTLLTVFGYRAGGGREGGLFRRDIVTESFKNMSPERVSDFNRLMEDRFNEFLAPDGSVLSVDEVANKLERTSDTDADLRHRAGLMRDVIERYQRVKARNPDTIKTPHDYLFRRATNTVEFDLYMAGDRTFFGDLSKNELDEAFQAGDGTRTSTYAADLDEYITSVSLTRARDRMDNAVAPEGMSAERFEELKKSASTMNKTLSSGTSRRGEYRTMSPFAQTRHFEEFTPKLILQEARKAGLDGVIFPNYRDMKDVSGRPSMITVKNIYEKGVKKGLNQMGVNVVNLDRIDAVDFTDGSIKSLPHEATGNAHRGARAVYFAGENENITSPTKVLRRAKGGPVDLRPKKLVHSGIGAMARQVM